MLLVRVESSQIVAVGYDPDTRVAAVEFRVKTGRSVYEYRNVGAETLARIVFADSVGRAFASTLKASPDAHPFRKVADPSAHVVFADAAAVQWHADLREAFAPSPEAGL